MKVLAIDPGNVQSAYVVWDGEKIHEMGKVENKKMKGIIADYLVATSYCLATQDFVIEKICCNGMAVGETVFETVFWTGVFATAIDDTYPESVIRVPRKDVKMHLCGTMRAKDSNIIQVLKDRFEPELQPKQRPKGLLKGVKADIWQALALAVYYFDTRVKNDIFQEDKKL
ncbi:MAG: hypothetical protein WC623_24000 [Pedobacter sp.]|uniref:hypothetical protein n=1 Tax=Pedobacter sp. TaxID=1411316 RepID=UPI0035663D1F